MDREKVIKALEYCRDNELVNDCNKCDYGGKTGVFCIRMINDVLTLLKEQEAEIKRLKRPDCEHANHDGAGCLGYCGCEQDDEPIDACKQCEKYTGNICAEY